MSDNIMHAPFSFPRAAKPPTQVDSPSQQVTALRFEGTLDSEVRAVVVALTKNLGEYRKFISYAANL